MNDIIFIDSVTPLQIYNFLFQVCSNISSSYDNTKQFCISIQFDSYNIVIKVIPVFVFCFDGYSIDLRGLMAENQVNLIPHTSEMNNYVVLRFRNRNSHTPPVS